MLSSIPLQALWPLLGLTASPFVFNTSEFMPIALLTDISRTFGMLPENTGLMITVYAWMVGLLSLPLMLVACHMRPRRLLLLTMLLFTAGQVGSGLAPNFMLLMGARILVACAHSIYWSIVAPLATRLVPPSHQPFALSMIATGTSIAMILGLPLGRLVGLIAGWRLTFFLIGAISFVAFLYLGKFFPDLSNGQAFTLQELPAILKNLVIYGVFFMSLSFATAYYTSYSYVEPYLALARCVDPDNKSTSWEGFGVASGVIAPVSSTLAALMPIAAVESEWIPVVVGVVMTAICLVIGETVIRKQA